MDTAWLFLGIIVTIAAVAAVVVLAYIAWQGLQSLTMDRIRAYREHNVRALNAMNETVSAITRTRQARGGPFTAEEEATLGAIADINNRIGQHVVDQVDTQNWGGTLLPPPPP